MDNTIKMANDKGQVYSKIRLTNDSIGYGGIGLKSNMAYRKGQLFMQTWPNTFSTSKEERLNVVPYQEEMKKKGLRIKDSNWKTDLKKLVEEYKPDLLAISSTEDMWELGMRILEQIRDYKIKNKIPVIAGGVFPTFAPEICITYDLVDMICVGEGENTLLDLCKKIEKKEKNTKLRISQRKGTTIQKY